MAEIWKIVGIAEAEFEQRATVNIIEAKLQDGFDLLEYPSSALIHPLVVQLHFFDEVVPLVFSSNAGSDDSVAAYFHQISVSHHTWIGQMLRAFDSVTCRAGMDEVVIVQGEIGTVLLRDEMIAFPFAGPGQPPFTGEAIRALE